MTVVMQKGVATFTHLGGGRGQELGGERRFPFGGSANLARQSFSPRSGCCVSTMDRDRAPHRGSCRASRWW